MIPRKLFDDAQRPKIEAFIKKLQELARYRARARTKLICFLPQCERYYGNWREPKSFRSCETPINKKRLQIPQIDESITAFDLH